MKRLTLTQRLNDLAERDSVNVQGVRTLLSHAVVILIRRAPFYGILLAKLARFPARDLKSPLGLAWRDRNLVLLYNPERLVKGLSRGDELLALLVHVALHVVWLHPVVYPHSNRVTKLATDLEVNQYIKYLPPHAVTLRQIERRFHLHLPRRTGSRVYLQILRHYFLKHRKKGVQAGSLKKRLRVTDSHQGWQSAANYSRGEKTHLIKKLLQRSYQQTSAKSRGNLPGNVREQLLRMKPRSHVKWQKYVRMGLGQTPLGTQPSRARFNRRQAYRMELPGRISNYVRAVSIFVDNSGSMSDHEISYLLGQIGSFLRKCPVRVTIYSFDTRIHRQATYTARSFQQLHFKRYGGGGTRFQSIFDFCHERPQRFTDQLIMIFTDGQGEHRLRYYHVYHLLWLLTMPKPKFSVRNVRGRVVSLTDDSSFQERFNR